MTGERQLRTRRDDPPSIEAETALGKFKVRGLNGNNVNAIFTMFGFMLTCLVAWVLWTHDGNAKESAKQFTADLKDVTREMTVALKSSNSELATALREMAQAAREQNCLLSLPATQREQNVETCRRLSR